MKRWNKQVQAGYQTAKEKNKGAKFLLIFAFIWLIFIIFTFAKAVKLFWPDRDQVSQPTRTFCSSAERQIALQTRYHFNIHLSCCELKNVMQLSWKVKSRLMVGQCVKMNAGTGVGAATRWCYRGWKTLTVVLCCCIYFSRWWSHLLCTVVAAPQFLLLTHFLRLFVFRIWCIFNLHLSNAFVEIGPAVHGSNSDTLIMYLNQYN